MYCFLFYKESSYFKYAILISQAMAEIEELQEEYQMTVQGLETRMTGTCVWMDGWVWARIRMGVRESVCLCVCG